MCKWNVAQQVHCDFERLAYCNVALDDHFFDMALKFDIAKVLFSQKADNVREGNR